MSLILKSRLKTIAAIVCLLLIVGGVYHKVAQATISAVTLTPTTPGTDDVAGKSSAHYDVEYNTDAVVGAVSLSQIVVTFPGQYTITSGSLDPSTAINSSNQGNCSAQAGILCHLGDDIGGDKVTVTSMTGNNSNKTITINFASFSPPIGVTYDFEFSILQGIQNPTLASAYTGASFLVDDDAAGNSAVSPASDVTIIAGPADHFTFTQQPGGSAPNGDFTTDAAFPTEPIVEARDIFENVATDYNSCVAISAGNGINTTLYKAGFGVGPNSCIVSSGIGSSAVSGIADFTGSGAAYYTDTDNHTPFQITAAEATPGSVTSAASASLIPDVVATQLVWTQDPADCTSGIACTTQGIVKAQDALNVTDSDYTSSITFSLTGLGTLIGNAIQTLTAGILNIIGLGYANSDPSNDESTAFIADDSILSSGQSNDVTVLAVPASTPTATPAAGAYYGAQSITLASANSTSIRYTTDGTDPSTCSSGTLYASAISVSSSATIKARGCNNDSIVSSLGTFAYVINSTTETAGGGYNPNTVEIPNYTPPAPTPSPAITPAAGPSSSCAQYLTGFLRKGARGADVSKLQAFLRKQNLFTYATDTGFFGSVTEAAVKAFQEKYRAEILTSQDLPAPTGFVMSYTLKKINSLVCAGL